MPSVVSLVSGAWLTYEVNGVKNASVGAVNLSVVTAPTSGG